MGICADANSGEARSRIDPAHVSLLIFSRRLFRISRLAHHVKIVFCVIAKAPASRAQLTKGPAHALPAPTHGNLQQKSDPCIFNSLHTLASLFCKERQLISFSFNRLRTLYQNNGGVPPRGNVVLVLPHFFKPFVFTLMQIAPPTTPFF